MASVEQRRDDGTLRVVRVVRRGEKLVALFEELKALTYETGHEHALVKLVSGERALVTSGQPYSVQFGRAIARLYAHTHPYDAPATGPSAIDELALRQLGQPFSYLLERGELTKFRARPAPR